MNGHNFFKRTASKVVSWILIMAMLVTAIQISPAGTQDVNAADEGINITIHYEKPEGWTTPALQYWGETIEVSGSVGGLQKIAEWSNAEDGDKFGYLLTQDGETDFYTITLKGTTPSGFGFQFLDFADPDGENTGGNTGGKGFVSTMTEYNGEVATDLYYLYDSEKEAYVWYLDAAGTTPMPTPEYINLTFHFKNVDDWTVPTLYYWNSDLTVSDYAEAISWWGSTAYTMKPDTVNSGFYTVTIKGTLDGGFLFVDTGGTGKQTTDTSLLTDPEMAKYIGDISTDLYYIKTGENDGKMVGEWYMDPNGEVTLASTREVSESVAVNKDGSLAFTTIVEGASKVELVYGLKENEGESLKTVTLTAGLKNSYTSSDLWFGDAAEEIIYYYIVDGEKKTIDPLDNPVTYAGVEFLQYDKVKFEGRAVYVPGTFPGNGWTPSRDKMTYYGEGIYTFTYENVPAGNYQYKIAMGSWTENYGSGGVFKGPNIAVTVSAKQDVTVYYSDFSHYSRTSIDYVFGASIELSGTGIPVGTTMTDNRLTGIYSAVVPMMGIDTYTDTVIEFEEETYEFDDYEVTEVKDVNFYFDPETEIYYNDASDIQVETANIKYDTKDTAYKSVYGAIATEESVTFSIDTGGDATKVMLYIKGNGTQKEELVKEGGIEGGVQRWKSDEISFNKLGQYTYFFVISVGSSITVYGDDDGNYGTGTTSTLTELKAYDLIVYQAGYETPDWMKDAVIYQIFPDRFFDGDVSNNTAQTSARGAVDYEYVTNWYTYPENPEQLTLHPDEYPDTAYSGDGNWSNEIYGGDLKGITERIDYLKALGVNVIYLNPVFSSISSHRYDTSDYKVIDPILGTLGDFTELVEIAEANDMHIILDGVYNHVSDDSIYFDRYYKFLGTSEKIGAYPYWAYVYDYMAENEEATQDAAEAAAQTYFGENYDITNFDYAEWFEVYSDTDSYLTDDDGEIVCDSIGLRVGEPVYGYEGWWGYDSMPVIKATNGSEYQTGTFKEEIIGTDLTADADESVTQYWLSEGMNGWRLDVANEVSDETWQKFRESVKSLNEGENVIIGEIWTDAVEYLLGDMYDSVMNYVFRGAVLNYTTSKDADAADYIATLERLRERYPEEAFYAMMNLVGSHDTSRILSYLDGIDDDRNQKDVASAFPTYEATSDLAKQKQYLVAFLQFTYAGAPTIYYGDEIGMVGADDPDDRRGMTWGQGNKEIVEWYAKLAKIRSNYPALRTGTVEAFDSEDKAIVSYVRRDTDDTMVVLANNTTAAKNVTVNLTDLGVTGTDFTDIVSGGTVEKTVDTITVSVPALSGVILTETSKAKEIIVDTENLKPAYDSSYIVKDAKVTVSKTKVTLVNKNTSETITATGRGTIEWDSTNKTVATVSNGKITAVGRGTTTITATQEDGQVAACAVTVTIPATEITINRSTASIEKGKTLTLSVTKVTPPDSTDTVEWTSNSPSVATVNKTSGVVTAVGRGTATITATTTSGKTATCVVTVTVPAKSVTLNRTKAEVAVGKTVPLRANVNPTDSTDGVTWSSNKPSVATVDKNSGVVTGKSKGTATITATVNGIRTDCNVTVTIPATNIKVSSTEYIVKGKTKNLTATMTPLDTTDKVKWSTSNKKTVTVDSKGKIKGIKTGKATITATTSSGRKVSCTVYVVAKKASATSVRLNKSTLSLRVGKAQMLKATMSSKSTDALTWRSSNTKVVKVDKNGNVTAVKKGTATITVKTTSGRTARCKVTVK